MTGLFLTDYSVYGFLPNILTLKGRGFNTTTYSLIYGFALFMASWAQLLRLAVGQNGKKDPHSVVLRLSGCVRNTGFLRPLSCGHPAQSTHGNVGTVMAAMLKLGWGVVPAYLCERFPTRRRAAGVGFGYSSGALLGRGSASTSGGPTKSVYRSIEKQDMWLSPAVILTIGSIMTFAVSGFRPRPKTCGWTKLARRSGCPMLRRQPEHSKQRRK